MSFTALLIVSLVAFLAPLAVNLVRRLQLPSAVVEIVAGIAIGPSGFGWVHVDAPIAVLSTLGLAMLLFLAGLEIEVTSLRGTVLRQTAVGMGASLALGLMVGYSLDAVGVVHAPILIAIILASTSLGLIIPVLKDAGELGTPVGTSVVASAAVADFGCIVLLSLLFSRESTSTGAKLVLLSVFGLAALIAGAALSRYGDLPRVSAVFTRLQDTTAQIRIRFAVLLCIAFAALAGSLGLETILGAFVAGLILKVVDRDAMTVHPLTTTKLEAIGFGFLVPVFWVTSGLRFDLHALFAEVSTVARVPLFLAALLLVRGLPALAYRMAPRQRAAVAVLQATSLSIIVAATQIGIELHLIGSATAASLVGAGLLSAVVLPPLGLALLRGGPSISFEAERS